MDDTKLYTLKEVANMTKLTDRTLRNYLANETLQGIKIGGQWRFRKEDIDKLFKSCTYYNKRKDITEKTINDFIEGKINFSSSKNACIIIDIKDYNKEQLQTLYKKIKEIKKDDDVKDSVMFIKEDMTMRYNIIGPLDYIKKILNLIETR